MASEFIVNAEPQETRVALLENKVVTELYVERKRDEGIVGNVYKGKVTRILPGMQAAFVDIGLEKAGFLYVADVDVEHGEYGRLYEEDEEPDIEFDRRARTRRTPTAPIENLLQTSQDILVQVTKDPIGTKGCRLTSYVTLPGRYLVFMPTIDQVGVSRRIGDDGERKRLKKLVRRLKADGAGYIVRTVAEGLEEEEFQRDAQFLSTLWNKVREAEEQAMAPAILHDDLNLVSRTIRDLFTEDIEHMFIDSPEVYAETREFVETFYPHLASRIEHYQGREPIFDAHGVELEIERALGRRVWLKSGGYIVIDQTEALVSIDVNTGRFVGKRNPEETILKTNLEAIKEVVYQLRLRNIGGIIIIDFIDMERGDSKEKVFETLAQELRSDRSRTRILKISELGLVEMTRKRVRDSLGSFLCHPCPYCDGRGVIKSTTTVCYEIFRELRRVSNREGPAEKILVNAHPAVADLLLEEESVYLEHIEKQLQTKVVVKADKDLHREGFEVMAL